jgi:hypothetical protein
MGVLINNGIDKTICNGILYRTKGIFMTTAIDGIKGYLAGYQAGLHKLAYNPMASLAWRKGWFDGKNA